MRHPRGGITSAQRGSYGANHAQYAYSFGPASREHTISSRSRTSRSLSPSTRTGSRSGRRASSASPSRDRQASRDVGILDREGCVSTQRTNRTLFQSGWVNEQDVPVAGSRSGPRESGGSRRRQIPDMNRHGYRDVTQAETGLFPPPPQEQQAQQPAQQIGQEIQEMLKQVNDELYAAQQELLAAPRGPRKKILKQQVADLDDRCQRLHAEFGAAQTPAQGPRHAKAD